MDQARMIYVGQSPAILEWLCHHPRVKILAVYSPPSSQNRSQLFTCAAHYQIPIYWVKNSDEIEQNLPVGLDLAVCAFFEKISNTLLKKTRLGWLNLHPAALPERPGRYPTVEGVIEGDLQWGATLHWMTEHLDLGPIIDIKRGSRAWLDGPVELEARALKLGLLLLEEHLDSILDGYSSYEAQNLKTVHRSSRILPTLNLQKGGLHAWRLLKACEPFGGLPMRTKKHLILIKEGMLIPKGIGIQQTLSDYERKNQIWSQIAQWDEENPCVLWGRLDRADIGNDILTIDRLKNLVWSPYHLPDGEILVGLPEKEHKLFTFESGVCG